jgi:hypothetical protein
MLGVLIVVATSAGCANTTDAVRSSPTPLKAITASGVAPPTDSASSAPVVNNSDGAIHAAVLGWVDALSLASQNAALNPLQSKATNVCTCLSGEQTSINYLINHKLHLTVSYMITSYILLSQTSQGALVRVTISNGPYKAETANNSVVANEPAASQTNEFSLKREGSTWLVDTIF